MPKSGRLISPIVIKSVSFKDAESSQNYLPFFNNGKKFLRPFHILVQDYIFASELAIDC